MILQGSLMYLAVISTVVAFPRTEQNGLQDALYSKLHSHRMKYPIYMMKLYQSLFSGNGTDIAGMEHPALQESNTVLSFFAKSCTAAGNHWRLSFDMTSISRNTELKLVELRVGLPSFRRAHNITVDIFHSKDGKDMFFMSSFKTNPSATAGNSWKIFNLTRLLQHSIFHWKPSLHSDYIAAEDMTEWYTEYSNIREPEQLQQQNIDPLSTAHYSSEKVMLVVFAREKTPSHSLSLIKIVQSSKYIVTENTINIANVRRFRRDHKSRYSINLNNFLPQAIDVGPGHCRRVDMWVEFEKIEWGNRIIYPRRYNAYRCEGTCPVPLSETFKPTNHAYMKSLLKMYHSEKVECSSCIPVKTSALSMLIFEEDNVTVKHHEEMVVDACGCV
ncbi:nodal homolog 2-A-like [Hyperolius riggenbachi]|uniref:nodal homolog 2-A-like n=1 Tax=Hyperolius riggenbachi TaxID=752182 RepID=UPI0035A329AE